MKGKLKNILSHRNPPASLGISRFIISASLLLCLFIWIHASCNYIPDPNDWTNESAKQKYKTVAMDICSAYSPKYVALAVEANTYYEYHPADFNRFVTAYKDMYDSMKNSPGCSQTKIYVTFQLERMKGLGMAVGYSGKDQWAVLDKFDGRLDLLAFTTYPEIEYATPAEIPDDYYSEIENHVPASLAGKKIAITEMGWNSANIFPVTGNANSFQAQADFLARFDAITGSLKSAGRIEFVTWTFMYDFRDTGADNPFRTIGLMNSDGSAKDADNTVWSAWTAYRNAVQPSFPTGIGLMPANFPGSDSSDWLDFYQKVPEAASLLLVQTEWRDSVSARGRVPQVFADVNGAKTYHAADIIYGINFFNLDDGSALISR